MSSSSMTTSRGDHQSSSRSHARARDPSGNRPSKKPGGVSGGSSRSSKDSASAVPPLITGDERSARQVSYLIRSVVVMGLATAASIIAATVAIHFAISEKIIPIAVDSHGVVTPMVPLNEATLTESRVIGFTEECVRRAFSHDFLHYDQTIPLAENCFTQRAAKNYVEAMQPYIKLMEQERMVMAVSVPNPPRVIRAYTEDTGGGPVALWDLQVMIDLSFEGRDKRIPPTRSRLDITIRRVPLENTPSGILIDKFGVAPA